VGGFLLEIFNVIAVHYTIRAFGFSAIGIASGGKRHCNHVYARKSGFSTLLSKAPVFLCKIALHRRL
jgi:hypothetical protein